MDVIYAKNFMVDYSYQQSLNVTSAFGGLFPNSDGECQTHECKRLVKFFLDSKNAKKISLIQLLISEVDPET